MEPCDRREAGEPWEAPRGKKAYALGIASMLARQYGPLKPYHDERQSRSRRYAMFSNVPLEITEAAYRHFGLPSSPAPLVPQLAAVVEDWPWGLLEAFYRTLNERSMDRAELARQREAIRREAEWKEMERILDGSA